MQGQNQRSEEKRVAAIHTYQPQIEEKTSDVAVMTGLLPSIPLSLTTTTPDLNNYTAHFSETPSNNSYNNYTTSQTLSLRLGRTSGNWTQPKYHFDKTKRIYNTESDGSVRGRESTDEDGDKPVVKDLNADLKVNYALESAATSSRPLEVHGERIRQFHYLSDPEGKPVKDLCHERVNLVYGLPWFRTGNRGNVGIGLSKMLGI